MKLKFVKTTAFSVFLLFSMFVVSACGNLFGRKQNNKITVSFSSVLPEEFYSVENNARSAVPDFGSLSFAVTASSSSYAETVDLVTSSKDFKLALEEGDWKIDVEVYSVDSNNNRNAAVLMTGTTDISVSLDVSKNTSFKVPLFLSDDFEEGSGLVDLKVKIESDSKIDHGLWKLGSTLSGTLDYSQASEASISTDCAAGKHSLSVLFYNSEDFLVYSVNSIISVYAENTTNTWCAEDEIENGEAFGTALLITKEMVKEYETSVFFVGENSEEEEGTFTKPFKSLKRAIERINQLNDGVSTYKVYILGNEAETLAEEDKSMTITTTLALNLKIEAFSGNKASNNFELAMDFKACAENSVVSIKNLTLKNPLTSDSCAIILENCTLQNVSINKNGNLGVKGDIDIEKLYLGTDTETEDGNQIKIQINGDISGSEIGVYTLKQLDFDTPSIVLTEGFSDSNSEDSIRDYFTSVDTHSCVVGKLNGEAAIGLTLLEFNPQIMENVTFELEAAEEDTEQQTEEENIENTDSVDLVFDASQNVNAYVVSKETLTGKILYLKAYSADGEKTPITDSLQWEDIVVTCDGSDYGLSSILTTDGNKIQFNKDVPVPAGKYEIFGEAIYKAQNAKTGGTVYLEIK